MKSSASSQSPDDICTLNPEFGFGALRRRIHLIATSELVRAGIEDFSRSFRLRLWFDQGVVLNVRSHAFRYPLNACPFASGLL
ncbi:MAG: hypothetical protein FJ196_00940 [Gammaproteobacteria bacterium]|nr:hypothetical protein [Gammaproteobacteria bacterium]